MELLDYIREHQREIISHREIANGTGLTKGQVRHGILGLVRDGKLMRVIEVDLKNYKRYSYVVIDND